MNIDYNHNTNQLYTIKRSPHLAHKTLVLVEDKIPLNNTSTLRYEPHFDKYIVVERGVQIHLSVHGGDVTLATPENWTSHYMFHRMDLLNERFSKILSHCATCGTLELPHQENPYVLVMNMRWALENGHYNSVMEFLKHYKDSITQQDLVFLAQFSTSANIARFVLQRSLKHKGRAKTEAEQRKM